MICKSCKRFTPSSPEIDSTSTDANGYAISGTAVVLLTCRECGEVKAEAEVEWKGEITDALHTAGDCEGEIEVEDLRDGEVETEYGPPKKIRGHLNLDIWCTDCDRQEVIQVGFDLPFDSFVAC